VNYNLTRISETGPLSNNQEPGEAIMLLQQFSDKPGANERHLIRRQGNPLFRPERREVSLKELLEARELDEEDHAENTWKLSMFLNMITAMQEHSQASKQLMGLDEVMLRRKEIDEL
jgi:hypothetical protein